MRKWEDWEEQYLIENYQYMDTLELQKVLTNRTYKGIKRKATNMGLTKDIYLKEGLTYSPKEVGDILGLSEWTIRKYANEKIIYRTILVCKGKRFHKFTTECIVNFMYKHPSKWINKPYDKEMIQTLLIDFQGTEKSEKTQAIREYMNIGNNTLRLTFNTKKVSMYN